MEVGTATRLCLHGIDLQVIEMWPLRLLPAWLTRRRVVEPMRRHTAGTILVSEWAWKTGLKLLHATCCTLLQASALALERGWSINLGGGMHHASFDNGEAPGSGSPQLQL